MREIGEAIEDVAEAILTAIEEPGFGWFCVGMLAAVLMLLVATTQ